MTEGATRRQPFIWTKNIDHHKPARLAVTSVSSSSVNGLARLTPGRRALRVDCVASSFCSSNYCTKMTCLLLCPCGDHAPGCTSSSPLARLQYIIASTAREPSALSIASRAAWIAVRQDGTPDAPTRRFGHTAGRRGTLLPVCTPLRSLTLPRLTQMVLSMNSPAAISSPGVAKHVETQLMQLQATEQAWGLTEGLLRHPVRRAEPSERM